jgi:cell wall-associated NlpC family hydrolase
MLKNINKITVLIITLMLILSLCACGANGGAQQTITPPDTTDNKSGSNDEAVLNTADGSNDEAAANTTDGSNDEAADVPASENSSENDVPNPDDTTATTKVNSTADSIVTLAESLAGAEYEWGAAGPNTFDNSGFVYYCFKENGITLPRKTGDMFAAGTAIEPEELLPGDLVFFTYNEDRSASYVGIYIGDGQFIAESNENSPVSTHDMTLDYYTKIFVGARRYQ